MHVYLPHLQSLYRSLLLQQFYNNRSFLKFKSRHIGAGKMTPYIFKSVSLFSEMPSVVAACCLSESLLLLRRAINS